MLTCELFENPHLVAFQFTPNNHTTHHPLHPKMASNTTEEVKVLRLASRNYAEWNCCVCVELKQHTRPFLTREDDLVCAGCIAAVFERALQHDADWPARWGSEELNPHDFASVVDQGFTFRYHRKSVALAKEREELEPEPLEGQVLGRDYQVCPSCKVAVCLEDGCNHVICACGANFCFICGEVARDDGSRHWSIGGCPRYNAVGSGREEYDRDSDDMDISSDDDTSSESSSSEESSGESSSEEEEEEAAEEEEMKEEEEDMASFGDTNEGEEMSDGNAQDALFRLQNASYDHNLAMQLSSEDIQGTLRQFQESNRPTMSAEEREWIASILSIHSYGHHDPQGWDQDTERRLQSHDELIEHVLAARSGPEGRYNQIFFSTDTIKLLRRPIGGYFRMSDLTARVAACARITEKAKNASRSAYHMDVAIFAACNGRDRHDANTLVEVVLQDKVFVLRNCLFDFRRTSAGLYVEFQERRDPEYDRYASVSVGSAATLCRLIVDPAAISQEEGPVGLHPRA